MGKNILKSIKLPWIVLGVVFIALELGIILKSSTWVIGLAGTAADCVLIFFVGQFIYYTPKRVWQFLKEHKGTSVFCFICILFALALAIRCFHNHSVSSLYGQFSLFLQIFLLSGVIFGLFSVYVWKLDLWKIYLITGSLFGIGMMLVIPIGGVPDEIVHVSSAYRLSNIFLGIKNEADSFMMRSQDLKMIQMDLGRNLYQTSEGFEQYISLLITPLTDGSLVSAQISTISNPICYVVPALGIALGRILGLGTYITLMIGRIFNFVLYMSITTYAIKKISFGKLQMLVLLLMPVAVQQGMSYSYDVLVNSLSLVMIAYAVKFTLGENKNLLTRKEAILLVICTILLFPQKGKAYFLISLLPWLIYLAKKYPLSNKAVKIIRRIVIGVFLLFIAAIIVWAKTGASSYQYTPNILTYNGTATEVIYGYSISYFIAHPFDLFTVLFNTMKTYRLYYYTSFIGKYLGWLDINIYDDIIIVYTFLLAFASIKRTDNKIVLCSKVKILFGIVSLITFGFILAGMLFAWSPIEGATILGVQGRYFFPFALLILLILGTEKLQIDSRADSTVMAVLIMSIFVVVEFLCLHL